MSEGAGRAPVRALRRADPVRVALLVALAAACPALAQERELDQDPAPSSTDEIETPTERVFPEEVERRPPLIPRVREKLQDLPPFFADTILEVRGRTYYRRLEETIDQTAEAWAGGGSVYYRSGWLADTVSLEVEGFTSQPLVAENSKDGTQLLEPVQNGYSALGIANATLRYGGIHLTAYRQYLDLPYVNRQDNRMMPNTFEAVTLTKPEGVLRLSTGYAWKVKLRDSDTFRSFTAAPGFDKDRGFAHAAVILDPGEDLHFGVIGAAVPDLFAGVYSDVSVNRHLGRGVQGRLDAQFTWQSDIGDDVAGEVLEDTWNLGLRTSVSYAGAVFRVGGVFTGAGGPIFSIYGTSPSYVDLMLRPFTREDEKAVLASLSYDFSGIGLGGLTAIVNFVAGFDGKFLDRRRDAQEVDLTIDYRLGGGGWLESFWLRVRGAYLNEQRSDSNGTDVRVILRYDIPVI